MIFWFFGGIVVVVSALAAYVWRIASVGCGYKAKVLCSGVFVCGRKFSDVLRPDVSADAYKIMRLFRASLDAGRKSVTVSFLGLKSQRAQYRPGWGATLTAGTPAEEILPKGAAPSVKERPWPVGSPNKELDKVLADMFSEPDPKRLRRTRAGAVFYDGKLIGERYASGFGPETPMPGWSMTKSVVNALIGVMVREGKLALEQDRLFKSWCAPGDGRGAITVDDLLRMSSGLGFSEVYSNPLSDVTQMLYNSKSVFAAASSKSLAFEPKTKWYYSSATTNILCRLIRDTLKDDRAYWSLPHRELFEPLGMSSAVFETDAGGDFVGSSYMFASAQDWGKFGELFRLGGIWNGRRILPEGWTEYSTRVTPASSNGGYGAHWWLKLQKEFGGDTEAAARIPEDAFFALGHEGQTLSIIPSKKLVAVRHGMSIHIDAWNQAEYIDRILAVL
jgi:hypothetical protein